MERDYWVHCPALFETHNEKSEHVFKVLLDELTPHLSQGTVKVMGKEFLERRLTCYMTLSNTKMKYSGRTLEIIPPPKDSYIEYLFTKLNSIEFKKLIKNHPYINHSHFF